MSRNTYSDERKAGVLADVAATGETHAQIAKRHDIPPGTVSRWVSEANADRVNLPPAVACLLLSDWHIGALVESDDMRGMYCYDTNVCEDRINRLRSEAVAYLKAQAAFWNIKRLYLLWAGDIQDGIHAYRTQRYRLQLQTPRLQRNWAKPRVLDFVDLFAKAVDELVCMVCKGNHTDPGWSDAQPEDECYDTRLFYECAMETRNLTNVAWEIHAYETPFQALPLRHSVYVEHGENVPWGGKASQPTPMTWQHCYNACMDEGRIHEVCCWGHRHTPAYLHGRPNILSNGCLTGYNEYARKGKLRPTLPAQWFFGLSENGLQWVQNIVLGAWPETHPDERTGFLRGDMLEEAS